MDYREFVEHTGETDLTIWNVCHEVYQNSNTIPDVGGKPVLAKWYKRNQSEVVAIAGLVNRLNGQLQITAQDDQKLREQINKLEREKTQLEAANANLAQKLAENDAQARALLDKLGIERVNAMNVTTRAEHAEGKLAWIDEALKLMGVDTANVERIARALAVDHASLQRHGADLSDAIWNARALFS